MDLVPLVNQLLGVLTLIGGVCVVVLLLSILIPTHSFSKKITHAVSKNALLLSFFVSTLAMLGSLYYSEIAGYEPCKLCWYQRIFMYPQVFLLGYALKKKDNAIIPYALMLSLIGALIAFYHYMLQLGIAPPIPCSAVGASISCSKQFVLQWGYISIPVMALTAFAMMSSFLYIGLREKKSSK